MISLWSIRLLVIAALLQANFLYAADLGLSAPDGFKVTLYADDELAHDIFSMTIDSQGRVVVAGRNYVKTLHDDDQDGVADRSTLFSDFPKSGAHGMLFLGNDLLCTGDNSLLLIRDSDADGKADGPPETVTNVRHSEHGANGLTFGPDGWVYLICGNDANVYTKHVGTPHSPINQPKFGALLRFNPQTWESEVVAHGLRNPYDLAINADGKIFTVDADGERDQYLPWYTPNRLFDLGIGHHHGWVLNGFKRSWNRPESMFDSGSRLVEVGRGSPTGVEVYRHDQFPKEYKQGVFSCCWTLGKIYFYPLNRDGSGYQSEKTIFLETKGEVGLAPVDIAVGPNGDMFLAIGGRGTRGSIYRISYEHFTESKVNDQQTNLEQVLTAKQPLSAWSKAQWVPLANKLGKSKFEQVALDADQPLTKRLRAIEILTELFDGLNADTSNALIEDDDDEIVSRTAWSLGVTRPETADPRVIKLTGHESLLVQRTAWEVLASSAAYNSLIEDAAWESGLNSNDRQVRSAAIAALERVASRVTDFQPNTGDSIAAKWVLFNSQPSENRSVSNIIDQTLSSLTIENSANVQDDAIRVLQLVMGDIPAAVTKPDVYAGYTAGDLDALSKADKEKLSSHLAEAFPLESATANREILRTLAMLMIADPAFIDKALANQDPAATVQEDIHLLIALSKIPGERSKKSASKMASLYAGLHYKMEDAGYFYSRNWSQRLEEAFQEELNKNPALTNKIIRAKNYGRLEHAAFLPYLPKGNQQTGIKKIIEINDPADLEDTWPVQTVKLIMTLPEEEALGLLRDRWEDYNLRELILIELAKLKLEEDRGRFVEELLSVKPQSVLLAADTLRRMPREEVTEDQLLTAMKALRSTCTLGQNKVLRTTVARILRYWTDEPINIRESVDGLPIDMYEPWFVWFAQNYPEQNKILESYTGGNASQWKERIAQIDWSIGKPEDGKKLFSKLSCKQCHADSGRLGPNLNDATGRFNHHDLFMAVVDPNKDVSPLFHTTQILTSSGKSYIGMLIYESPDGTLMQTGPGKTIRIAGDEIIERRKSRRSIMPVGLLNGVNDQQLADLYSYLQSLRVNN